MANTIRTDQGGTMIDVKLADEIKFGKVKWFSTKDGKNFGFILRNGQPDLHFHHANGTAWRRVNDVFCFADPFDHKPSCYAEAGSIIYYIEGMRRGKPTATAWALGEDLNKFVEAQERAEQAKREIWNGM